MFSENNKTKPSMQLSRDQLHLLHLDLSQSLKKQLFIEEQYNLSMQLSRDQLHLPSLHLSLTVGRSNCSAITDNKTTVHPSRSYRETSPTFLHFDLSLIKTMPFEEATVQRGTRRQISSLAIESPAPSHSPSSLADSVRKSNLSARTTRESIHP